MSSSRFLLFLFSFKEHNQDLLMSLLDKIVNRFSIFHFETLKELFHILRSTLELLIILTPCTFIHIFFSKFKNNHFSISRTIPLSLLANIMSSTYKEMMTKFFLQHHESKRKIINLWNLEYHCQNDYLMPYIETSSLQTLFSCLLTSIPIG